MLGYYCKCRVPCVQLGLITRCVFASLVLSSNRDPVFLTLIVEVYIRALDAKVNTYIYTYTGLIFLLHSFGEE